MAFGLPSPMVNAEKLGAMARKNTLSPMLASSTPSVEPERVTGPSISAPADPAAPAAPPVYGGKTGAALARDKDYIRDQVNKGWNQRYGTDAPEDEQTKWLGYAMRPDVYGDRKIRVGWNPYLYDRLATPGSEGASSVDPGDETVVGYSSGVDTPMGALDPGASSAGGDNSLLAQILAQLSDRGSASNAPAIVGSDGQDAAGAFLRRRNGARDNARRDVFRGGMEA